MKYANVRIILVVTYLKPRSDKGLIIEKLDEFLEELSNHNGPIIFGGDFNIDILQQSNLVNNYLNTIAANGFILTSDTPTRITAESNTCIDHFFVKKIPEYEVKILEEHTFTDHCPILLKFRISRKQDTTKIFRDLKFLNDEVKILSFQNSL